MAIETVDFGTDIGGALDMDDAGSEVSGITLLSQDLARRLDTDRGDLIDDPNYGFGLRSLIDVEMTARQIAMVSVGIDSELMKDDRVLRSVTSGEFIKDSPSTGKFVATIIVTTAAGPFRLVVSIDSLTVEILRVEP